MKTSDIPTALIAWVKVREEIFTADTVFNKELWTRLAEAENKLMQLGLELKGITERGKS